MDPRPIVDVLPDQIAAATAIHDEHMPAWASTDRALTLLAESVPSMGPDAITLKAAVVDRLYYTRHYHLGGAIDRIVEVLANPPEEPIAMVEAIAPVTVAGKDWWHWSFASKFAHWFIDDSLPIYDQWAIRAASFHFGKIKWATTAYRDFAQHVQALREASGVSCTTREMDRYLWLAGMYRAWGAAEDKGKLQLSAEVLELFSSNAPAIRHALAELLGVVGTS